MTSDPYLPSVGTDTFDADHLELHLDVRLAANRVSGTAVWHGRLLKDTSRLEFDLHRLSVSQVRVEIDGDQVSRARATAPRRTPHRVLVELGEVHPAGAQVRVALHYAGTPKPRRSPWGTIGWEELTDGVLVAGQPHGASTWFPCVESPRVRTTAEITLTCDAGYLPVANGVGRQVSQTGSRVTWSWHLDRPVPAYLLTAQIGRYRIVDLPGQGSGPPIMLAVTPEHQQRALTALGSQHRMMELFERHYGPYPFEKYTAVVAAEPLEIPLECAALSLFGTNHLDESWESERLIAHEMSHQWFGNAVTLGVWSDLWLHEGFACFSEWLWSESSGGPSLTQCARMAWDGLAEKDEDIVLTAPGAADMFDDRVYKRGALTLVALRELLGTDVFARVLRTWIENNRFGTVDSAMFRAHVQSWAPAAGVSVAAVDRLLTDWTEREELPAFPG
ncbi:aminopeptidase N [Micrococcus cohnii]|uniref:Aminopeptidase N n=1 Tax=Micrococcus cohnii TaxID=993416 RepID=A0A7W7GNS0_9MICC|nr:M1 family metallopeptidase [Micrococcus cohnii]MBB4735494.1 aminopeptidase N [Micrococcus cohnii]